MLSPAESGRMQRGQMKGTKSHMLNTEVHGDKVCRVRLPNLKPVHGRVKPRITGWRCVSRPTRGMEVPKTEGPPKDHTR